MQLDEYVKKAPEVYQVGHNYRLNKIHEFSFDDSVPPFNCLVMWEPPAKGFTYTVGVDPGWGVGGDRSVIHVNRDGTMRSKDCQVAEFITDDINMHDLAPICYLIGKLYENTVEDTEALMSIECNISDDIVHDLRTKFSYGNMFVWKYYDNVSRMMSNKLGWWTTQRTRPKLINKVMQYVKHGWWDIASPWLVAEMETVEQLDDKAQIKAAQGFYDDIFMAGAIALWSAHDLEFGTIEGMTGMAEGELAAARERRAEERWAAEFIPKKGENNRSYQNTAVTAKQVDEVGDE